MSPSFSLKSALIDINTILDTINVIGITPPWFRIVTAITHLIGYLIENHAEDIDATAPAPQAPH